MKKKILSAIGALFCLVILFSACSDDKSSAPSAVSDDAMSSSSETAVPTSSESTTSSESEIPQSSAATIPQSSADAIPLSSESQKSSSSFVPPWSGGYWSDGVYYNPGACCADTVYIEDGKERYHKAEDGVCPPPSVVTISCFPPVRVNLDSIREAEAAVNKNSQTIETYECLEVSEMLKKGVDSLKNAQLLEYSDGTVKIAYWQNKYCAINADFSFELSGDTLSVNLGEVPMSSNCGLYCKLGIEIPDSLREFSYFKFEGRLYGLL